MKGKNSNTSTGKKQEQNNKNTKLKVEEDSNDIYPHLKKNILSCDKNCKHSLTDETYYL